MLASLFRTGDRDEGRRGPARVAPRLGAHRRWLPQLSARHRWLLRLASSGALALGLAYFPYKLLDGSGERKAAALRVEHERLVEAARALRAQNRLLRTEIAALKSDVGAIEDIARDELGMVRPGELIVRLPAPISGGDIQLDRRGGGDRVRDSDTPSGPDVPDAPGGGATGLAAVGARP